MILERDSEDLDMEETNVCRGCNEVEGWNDHSLWIGCSGSNCNSWFHKTCISNDVTAMNEDELNDYEFFVKHVRQRLGTLLEDKARSRIFCSQLKLIG